MKKKLVFILFVIITTTSYGQFADCENPLILCSKEELKINKLDKFGFTKDDLGETECSQGVVEEQNSIWIKWEIEESGDLGFLIDPIQESDDIDFVVYKISSNGEACNDLESVRCMASGQNLGSVINSKCIGITGLKNNSNDFNEYKGCHGEDDNFLAPLQTQKGEYYLLFINNYSSEYGFNLKFTGDAKFSSSPCKNHITEKILVSEIFPNPAHGKVNITINLPQKSEVTISIFDALGKQQIIENKELFEGEQEVSLSVKGMTAGTYFMYIKIGEEFFQRKFTKI